jgi:hypothetical protein
MIPHRQARHGILTLTGYGLRVAVERGHLVVEDGVADERRQGRFSRVSQLKRLLVLGHAGTNSLEALRWLRDVGRPTSRSTPCAGDGPVERLLWADTLG